MPNSTVSGFKVGDKYNDKQHGQVEVVDVKGSGKGYDLVKVRLADGSRKMVTTRSAGSRKALVRDEDPYQRVRRMRKEGKFDPNTDDEYDAMRDARSESGTWNYKPDGSTNRFAPGRRFR